MGNAGLTGIFINEGRQVILVFCTLLSENGILCENRLIGSSGKQYIVYGECWFNGFFIDEARQAIFRLLHHIM